MRPSARALAALAAIVAGGGILVLLVMPTGPSANVTDHDAGPRVTPAPDATPPPDLQVSAATLKALYNPSFVLDTNGLSMNGTYVEGTRSIPRDAFAIPNSVATQLHATADAMDALPLPVRGKMHATLSISPDVGAPLAGSVLSAIAAMYRSVTVTVGPTTFAWTYLSPARIPTESFFYLTPRSPFSSGFTMARQNIVRDLKTNGPTCRIRKGRKSVASPAGLGRAAAAMCWGEVRDCVEHVEIALPIGGTIGELAPWIQASLALVGFGYARFVAEGASPIPEAVDCDAGVPPPSAQP